MNIKFRLEVLFDNYSVLEIDYLVGEIKDQCVTFHLSKLLGVAINSGADANEVKFNDVVIARSASDYESDHNESY